MIQNTKYPGLAKRSGAGKIKNTKHGGFTLIELVIAIAIFIIVISVVLSLLMTGLRGQRKVFALQNIQDNARFLVGFMAKEIRMSEINGVTSYSLNITRHDGTNVIYTFDTSQKQIERDDGSTSGPINSDEVLVTGNFYSLGVGTGDGQQPRLTILLKVETAGGKVEEKAEIILQTTLSPRNLEL